MALFPKPALAFIILLFFFTRLTAQKDSVVKYFRYATELNSANNALTRAVYYYRDGLWYMESKYISNGRTYMKGSYKDGPGKTQHGPFEQYYENGKPAYQLFLKDGKVNGLYKKWHENGRLSDSVFYKDDQICNKGRSWNDRGEIIAIYDLDDNGNGKVQTYWGKDSLFGEGNYSSGKKSGTWNYYNREGKKNWEINYENGESVSVKCLDASSQNDESCIFEKEAEFKGGDSKWVSYLSSAISEENYPSKKLRKSGRADLFGKVIAQFVVDKDGNVSNVTIIQPLNEIADAIVIKVLQNSPRWVPAVQYGKKVKAYRLQPVTFRDSQ